jgi:chromosome segregation ATPase
VYAADFQLQLMERKVARASGVRSPTEQKELHAKIAELTEECERYTAQHRMLNDQYKRLINDVKQTKRIAHEKEQELEKLEGQISETEMKTDAASRAFKKLIKEKEQSMVAFDVLKLEGKRLREQLNAKADEVFGLTNRKFQLQMSMEERQEEIKVLLGYTSDVLALLRPACTPQHARAHHGATSLPHRCTRTCSARSSRPLRRSGTRRRASSRTS